MILLGLKCENKLVHYIYFVFLFEDYPQSYLRFGIPPPRVNFVVYINFKATCLHCSSTVQLQNTSQFEFMTFLYGKQD